MCSVHENLLLGTWTLEALMSLLIRLLSPVDSFWFPLPSVIDAPPYHKIPLIYWEDAAWCHCYTWAPSPHLTVSLRKQKQFNDKRIFQYFKQIATHMRLKKEIKSQNTKCTYFFLSTLVRVILGGFLFGFSFTLLLLLWQIKNCFPVRLPFLFKRHQI